MAQDRFSGGGRYLGIPGNGAFSRLTSVQGTGCGTLPYNSPYYAEQFDAFGLSKVKDLFALEVRAEEYKGQLDKLASKLLLRGRITVRPLNLRRWNQELAFVRDCYNKAWAHNWGFVPWTDRELAVLAKQVKPLIDPRLALVGEIDGASQPRS